MARKSVYKKVRFDVFKRDCFICQYCGNTPPAVILELDHINPVSKGGGNEEDNLITACFDCNRGKGANELHASPATIVEKSRVIAEREEQLREFNKLLKAVRRRETRNIQKIEKILSNETEFGFTDKFKESVRLQFLSRLTLIEVEDAMRIAVGRFDDPDDIQHERVERIIKYFCGICWNKIKVNDDG